MNTEELTNQLKARIEALVKRGEDVRADTAKLVEEASGKFYQAKDGLSALVKAVAEGAVEGAQGSLPEHAESGLKAVVEGLADGLAKSAQAVRLTLEESTASGNRFATEDLTKIANDFRTIGEEVVEVVTTAAGPLGGHLKQQTHNLAEHARQTLHDIWPPLESAIHAAQQDPVKLGHETVHAAAAAARQAAGVLFSELGQYLQKAGDKLKP